MSEHIAAQAKAQTAQIPVASGLLQRASITPVAHGTLQRCSNGVECPECRARRLQNEGTLQRAAINVAPTPAIPPIVHNVLNSSGQPLNDSIRAFMEPRFGHDFSHVRVHTDAQAAKSANAVNALAYTVGKDVVFGTGQYMPETMTGKRLLAHELTHVVQQAMWGAGAGMQRQLEIGAADDIFEQEANQQATVVMNSTDTDVNQQATTATSSTTKENSYQQKKTDQSVLQKPQNDISKAPADSLCNFATGKGSTYGLDILFPIQSSSLSATELAKLDTYKKAWIASGSVYEVAIDGYASADGPQTLNWQLSCKRAKQVKTELSTIIPSTMIKTTAYGETNTFSQTTYEPNRRAMIITLAATPPAPHPTPAKPLCPSVPISTPSTCAGRHNAYCEAAKCFPTNPWLACACIASGEVCEAVDAFGFISPDGKLLEDCVLAPPAAPLLPVMSKSLWFLRTNELIWSHWRDAFEALHDSSRPIPTTLTPEWGGAVITCRRDGLGSKHCCEAQVIAEQSAIDRFSPYSSAIFGDLPTDVPGTSVCSQIVYYMAPGLAFTGNFGKLADRIVYGIKRCCS